MIAISLLLPLYAIGIQYKRGGWWLLALPFAVIALAIDVLLNYTELALLTLDFPQKGEWTFSTRLSRVCREEGKRGSVCRYITKVLDAIDPSGKHIL